MLVLAVLLQPAQAREYGATFGAGVGWFWTDPNENLDDTWAVVPRLGYTVHPRVTIEADFGLHQGFTRGWGYGYDAATPRLNLLLNMAPDAPVEPFIAGGPGVIYKHVRRSADSWEPQAPEETNIGNYINPDTDVLMNFGLGAYIPLGGAMALRIDGRSVYNVGSEEHGDIPDSFLNWEATVGFAFRGSERRKDTDLDGIVDHLDACPTNPEDYDSFEDTDGCPDEDNDKDGIKDVVDECRDDPEDFDSWQDRDGCPDDDNDHDGFADARDQCPNEPEDLDHWRDEDGCPDEDNDQDGVLDGEDRCPNDPEDRDDFEDYDGCADPDNDKDGIIDLADSCPDMPEVYNGHDDEDGCPDDLPPEVRKFIGVIHGINFEYNSDKITVGSYQILDEAAFVLVQFPELRIEVQGHTDSDGSDEFNLDLSARRAEAVVRYLVGRGIDPSRLEWVGYGESRPLLPNDSDQEKAVNRRVEFHLLDQGVDGTGR